LTYLQYFGSILANISQATYIPKMLYAVELRGGVYLKQRRMNLNRFRRLNTFLSPDFGDRTDSYVVVHTEIRSTYVLIRSTFVLRIYVRTL
jgi:hypothetical protein